MGPIYRCAGGGSDSDRPRRDEFCAASQRNWDERAAINRRDTQEPLFRRPIGEKTWIVTGNKRHFPEAQEISAPHLMSQFSPEGEPNASASCVIKIVGGCQNVSPSVDAAFADAPFDL